MDNHDARERLETALLELARRSGLVEPYASAFVHEAIEVIERNSKLPPEEQERRALMAEHGIYG